MFVDVLIGVFSDDLLLIYVYYNLLYESFAIGVLNLILLLIALFRLFECCDLSGYKSLVLVIGK
jgi:hypothetical protein